MSTFNDEFNAALSSINGFGSLNTGGQIKFPASQNASTDANTLDDYEEGTYKVTIIPEESGIIKLNESYDLLSYTKIGRVVHIQGNIIISYVSNPAGSLIKVSLPFIISNSTGLSNRFGVSCFAESLIVGNGIKFLMGNSGDSFVSIITNASMIQENSQFYFNFTYIV